MSNAAVFPKGRSQEKYEDRVFRRVMEIYAANEGARMAAEVAAANADGKTPSSEIIERLFDRITQKNKRAHYNTLLKKIISIVATIAIIVVSSLSSYMVGIAGTIATGTDFGFTEMKVKVYDSFIEYGPVNVKPVYYKEDFLGWEAMYALTYKPKGYTLYDTKSIEGVYDFADYRVNGDIMNGFCISQDHFVNGNGEITTENAIINRFVDINGHRAIFVSTRATPTNPALVTIICWAEGDTLLQVSSFGMDPYEVLKIAEHFVRVK